MYTIRIRLIHSTEVSIIIIYVGDDGDWKQLIYIGKSYIKIENYRYPKSII